MGSFMRGSGCGSSRGDPPSPGKVACCGYAARIASLSNATQSQSPAACRSGARLERVNLGADLSRKGLKQSPLSLMVNDRYELDAVEARHQAFIDGEVTHSTAVRKLLPRA